MSAIGPRAPEAHFDRGARLDAGRGLELQLCDLLHVRGWSTQLIGQERVPRSMQRVLRAWRDDCLRPALIRWMPDILAVHGGPPERVVMLDAKTGSGPRFAIESRSVEVAEIVVGLLFTPVFFVCSPGGRVLTPRDVRERGRPGPVRADTAGSGEPYVLVDKHWGRPFGDVFPG